MQKGGKVVYKAVHFAGYIGVLSGVKPVRIGIIIFMHMLCTCIFLQVVNHIAKYSICTANEQKYMCSYGW